MIKAFEDKILAKRVGEDNLTSKGVVKTSTNKEKPLKVVIIDSAVSEVVKGDTFLIARFSGMEFEFENEEYLTIGIDDIIARITS